MAPAQAAEPVGFSGTDLNFLDQEFAVVQKQKKKAQAARAASKLNPPKPPALDSSIRTQVLGRFMLEKYFELPVLTHEEVDGYVYMRATAMRALEGCAPDIRKYWEGRRWSAFRVYRLKSRPAEKHPWLEVALPGAYFTTSARAIDVATNEAELAFLLVRPLVRELKIQRKPVAFVAKDWPASLVALSEELWDGVLRAQSTRDSANLDVSDEINVDLLATECIARAGYRPQAGLNYLRKLALHREAPWAAWFFQHSIGLDYRLERFAELVDEALAKKRFPSGTVINNKRFSSATKHWNLLP